MNPEMFKKYFIGDDCVCWSFGDKIDLATNRKVLFLYKKLKNSPLSKDLLLYDVVPSYKALAVYFDSGAAHPGRIIDKIQAFIIASMKLYKDDYTADSKAVVLPVVYDGEDLERIARLHNLTVPEVIKKHSAPEYQVAMVGFRPNFPYLIGLDSNLVTPRLDTPRISVPAGSIGIGGEQTGIYPEKSPGGWNLIGRTNPELLENIRPGDTVTMKLVREL
jgi:KipI family sensor histidine kinase inhibitor